MPLEKYSQRPKLHEFSKETKDCALTVTGDMLKNTTDKNHRRLPLLPPFLRVLSVGIGVTSSIRPIFMPERAKALSADWAPGPGVLVLFPPVALSLI